MGIPLGGILINVMQYRILHDATLHTISPCWSTCATQNSTVTHWEGAGVK